MNDLLFELGSEELPSGAVQPLAQALAANIAELLMEANLQHGAVSYFATPRRLAVLIKDVQRKQSKQTVSKRGPARAVAFDVNGQPTPALLGFARSCGVDVTDLMTITTDKGEWLAFESVQDGAPAEALLPAIINQAVAQLPIPKPMRWGNGEAEFARPVHWTILLFGTTVVPAQILGVSTGRVSYGHRFLSPQSIEITEPGRYVELLREHYVLADFSERRAEIVRQVSVLAEAEQLKAIMPEALIDEVTSIVEWPQALLASFNSEFLDVPAEALIAAMQVHQKCFALRSATGQLSANFITVANIISKNPKQVVLGNEKVMTARLSDARFFYQQDRKTSLAHHLAATENVIFQAKLGSLADKARRMEVFIESLAVPLQLDVIKVKRAAELSKCDLLTGMVGEFPELQGLMGYYYAKHDGESLDVAQALNEQYMPRFAADALPQTQLGIALSLTDRLDTLVGIFGLGQKPSGVKDPFKLRRHALAVVRMLSYIEIPLNLSTLLNDMRQVYAKVLTDGVQAMTDLHTFILDRLNSFYQAQGFSADQVNAVRACQNDWLYDIGRRLHALQEFLCLPDAEALAAACKRVNNILHQGKVVNELALDEALLIEPAEKTLWQQIESIDTANQSNFLDGNYMAILTRLASLRQPVDTFFNDVMVMVEDKRIAHNRLALLTRLQAVLRSVADIGLLMI